MWLRSSVVVATALIQPLARELPWAEKMAQKRKKKKKERERERRRK